MFFLLKKYPSQKNSELVKRMLQWVLNEWAVLYISAILGNLSKAVNPAGFRAFDTFFQDSRCSKMQSVADEKWLSEFWISGRFIPAYPYAYPNRMGVRLVSWQKKKKQDPRSTGSDGKTARQDPRSLGSHNIARIQDPRSKGFHSKTICQIQDP